MRRFLILAAAFGALTWAGAAQAGTFSFSGGDLSYVAPTGETNRVFLIYEEKPVRGFRLIDTGAAATAGAGCDSVGPNEAFCPTPDFVDHVLVSVGDEDDYVNTGAGTVGETRIEGGAGNDQLHSGSDFQAELDGGPGADVMSGEGAIVDYSSRTNPLTVTLGDGGVADDGEAGEMDLIADDIFEVLGGSGADTFTLTGAGALVLAGAGADHLSATDCVSGGMNGGPGNDVLEAEGRCSMGGASGNDTLIGGAGVQLMGGGDGADLLRGGSGRDSIFGGGGNDELIGGTGRDQARGDSGDDTFRMKDGLGDFIDGNQGTDRAHVDQGLDELHDIEQLF